MNPGPPPVRSLIPAGDFGDAPDGTSAHYPPPYDAVVGRFPTYFQTTNSRYGLTGGNTRVTSKEWLGVSVSRERGPRDSHDPDSIENLVDDDLDDGWLGGPCPDSTPSLPWPSLFGVTLTVRVSVAADAPAGPRYLNLLVDANHDGLWSSEWVVVDQAVVIAPGTSSDVVVGPFPMPLNPIACWTRMALTRTPISGSFADDGSGWDGGGTFQHGEIEDYLVANALAHARDAAYSSDSAHDFSADAASATAIASPPAADDFAAVDVSLFASAVATAHATATANASATATATAEAATYANAAITAHLVAEASTTAIAAACISCPCATLCAAAGASATLILEAVVHAEASATASAAATATAHAQATARASATATAAVEMGVHVSAFAAARAEAFAFADSYAAAVADADAYAAAASSAAAAALAAACGGNAEAAASAAADAASFAQTAAVALAEADAFAYAAAEAWAVAQVELDWMIRIRTSAETSAEWSSFAASAAASFTYTAQETSASAEAAAASIHEVFVGVAGVCSGACCMLCYTPFCLTADFYFDGQAGFSSTASGTAISSWALAHYRGTGEPVVGFRWQVAENDPSSFDGMGEFGIWDASLVLSGGANESNAMVRTSGVPVSRQAVVDDCGRPIRMFNMPVFEYTMQLSQPIPLPADGQFYVSARSIGHSPNANSFVLSSHSDTSQPRQPSYFLSPTQGYESAVPVASLPNIDCDHDMVLHPVTGQHNLAPGGAGHDGPRGLVGASAAGGDTDLTPLLDPAPFLGPTIRSVEGPQP